MEHDSRYLILSRFKDLGSRDDDLPRWLTSRSRIGGAIIFLWDDVKMIPEVHPSRRSHSPSLCMAPEVSQAYLAILALSFSFLCLPIIRRPTKGVRLRISSINQFDPLISKTATQYPDPWPFWLPLRHLQLPPIFDSWA
jgi:hypothetical protein